MPQESEIQIEATQGQTLTQLSRHSIMDLGLGLAQVRIVMRMIFMLKFLMMQILILDLL